jgi:hypothetical protein
VQDTGNITKTKCRMCVTLGQKRLPKDVGVCLIMRFGMQQQVVGEARNSHRQQDWLQKVEEVESKDFRCTVVMATTVAMAPAKSTHSVTGSAFCHQLLEKDRTLSTGWHKAQLCHSGCIGKILQPVIKDCGGRCAATCAKGAIYRGSPRKGGCQMLRVVQCTTPYPPMSHPVSLLHRTMMHAKSQHKGCLCCAYCSPYWVCNTHTLTCPRVTPNSKCATCFHGKPDLCPPSSKPRQSAKPVVKYGCYAHQVALVQTANTCTWPNGHADTTNGSCQVQGALENCLQSHTNTIATKVRQGVLLKKLLVANAILPLAIYSATIHVLLGLIMVVLA